MFSKQQRDLNPVSIITTLAILFVLALFSGCTTTRDIVVTNTETYVLKPPANLTSPTPAPSLKFTKKDLQEADWAKRAQLYSEQVVIVYSALNTCNIDKTSIIKWADAEEKNIQKAQSDKAAEAKKRK